MDKKGTSVFSNSLIWFGAGVSIAEIVTGTYLASLGMEKGILAVIIGHLIGCSLLFLAGVIGAKTKKSAMETVKISFGQKGSILFSVLNVIQLAGWTAIMIYDGALSANGIFNTGNWVWCIVIGVLIIIWIFIGIKNIEKVNVVANCMERYKSAHAADSAANETSGLSVMQVAGLFPKNRKQGKNINKKERQNLNITIRPEKYRRQS